MSENDNAPEVKSNANESVVKSSHSVKESPPAEPVKVGSTMIEK